MALKPTEVTVCDIQFFQQQVASVQPVTAPCHLGGHGSQRGSHSLSVLYEVPGSVLDLFFSVSVCAQGAEEGQLASLPLRLSLFPWVSVGWPRS